MENAEAENQRESVFPETTSSKAAMKVIEGGNTEEKDLGREEMDATFGPHEGEEYDPNRLSNIVDFLASKMKMEDASEVQEMLDRLNGNNDPEALKVLSDVLMNSHDEEIEDNVIGSRTDVYTVALYLLANTNAPKEEKTKVLASLVATFDDPKKSRYDAGIDGLPATPYFARLCKKAIDQHKINEGVRSQLKKIIGELPASSARMRKAIGRSNAWRVGIDL